MRARDTERKKYQRETGKDRKARLTAVANKDILVSNISNHISKSLNEDEQYLFSVSNQKYSAVELTAANAAVMDSVEFSAACLHFINSLRGSDKEFKQTV